MKWDAIDLADEIAALISLDTDRRDEGMLVVENYHGSASVLTVTVNEQTFKISVEEVK